MKLTKSDKERREKLINFSFFLFVSFFCFLYSENKMAQTYTQKGDIFTVKKGKTDTRTHTLFKPDNEALMYDQHETMRDFYCTNPYLEKLMDYPRRKDSR